MELNDINHQLQIKAEKSTRLRYLELQAARYGIDCPAYISAEIDRTKQDILDIELVTSARTIISNVWYEYDTYVDEKLGMTIHVDFSVRNRMNIACSVIVLFYFSDGDIIKDFNQQYATPDGQVCIVDLFTPSHIYSHFGDYWLFIPYDELHLDPGEHRMKFSLSIYDYVTSETTATYDNVPFTVSMGNLTNISSDKSGDVGFWIAAAVITVLIILGVFNSGPSSAVDSDSLTPATLSLIAPEKVIHDYYALINDRDYDRSWSMLSNEFMPTEGQTQDERFNSYESYWNTIEKVVVEKAEVKDQVKDKSATVFVTLQYFAKDGVISYQDLEFELKNSGDKWVVDQARVIQNR